MRRKDKLVNHCLCLLDYVSKHREEDQTIKSLAEAIEVSEDHLYFILSDAKRNYASYLSIAAHKYRFDYEIYPRHLRRTQKKVIDAEYKGYN